MVIGCVLRTAGSSFIWNYAYYSIMTSPWPWVVAVLCHSSTNESIFHMSDGRQGFQNAGTSLQRTFSISILYKWNRSSKVFLWQNECLYTYVTSSKLFSMQFIFKKMKKCIKYIFGSIFLMHKGSRKKIFYFSGPTTNLELSGHPFFGFFFSNFKVIFYLWFTPPPPPLSGSSLNWRNEWKLLICSESGLVLVYASLHFQFT